jgi:hypothetical protein
MYPGAANGQNHQRGRLTSADLVLPQEQKQGLVMDLRLRARILLQQDDLALVDLWILYWGHGGDCDPFEFDALIHELLPVSWFNMRALAWAVDDLAYETSS